jgi:Uma2 family endonuclease
MKVSEETMSTATLPTPVSGTPLMTAAEFLAQHGDESGIELVKGRVVRLPMPGGKHGLICINAAFLLKLFLRDHDLGRVMGNDTFLQTSVNPDSFRGADVSFLSYNRLPKEQDVPDGPIPAPELVIEVKSPTDRLKQLSDKAYEYIEAGVTVVVVLFPETKTAAIYRHEELPVRLDSTDELTLPDVLPDFRVVVSQFFK